MKRAGEFITSTLLPIILTVLRKTRWFSRAADFIESHPREVQRAVDTIKHTTIPQVLLIYCWYCVYYAWWFNHYNPHYWRQRHVISIVAEVAQEFSFDDIHYDYKFIEFSETLKSMEKPPFVIFYDSSNLDIFLNHICNLEFIPNALPRLVAVSFDKNAHLILKQKHPKITSVIVDLDPIKESVDEKIRLSQISMEKLERETEEEEKKRKNRRYMVYQLVLLMRARICASLALRGIDFWAMQQDSLWIENFESMDLEKRYPDYNLIFDTVGNGQLREYQRMHGWICGSTFFVRGNPTSFQFFSQVDAFMTSHQSPDSSIMTYLCGHRRYKCQRLPRWIVSSSDYFRGLRDNVPVMIQVDSEQKKETKMQLFQRANFIFRHENGTCDRRAVHQLRDAVRLAFPEKLFLLKHYYYEETLLQRIHYAFKKIFNVDRYNNKVFLTVHYSLV